MGYQHGSKASDAVLGVSVPIPFEFSGGMLNSVVAVTDHCTYFLHVDCED